MTTYIGLGSRMVAATADQTGNNPGNWTNAFSAAVLGVHVAQYEIYRGVAEHAPPGAVAIVKAGARTMSFTAPGFGAGSEWDPTQPPILVPGQDVYFYWNAAAAGTPPVVTLWLRYDPSVPGNPRG